MGYFIEDLLHSNDRLNYLLIESEKVSKAWQYAAYSCDSTQKEAVIVIAKYAAKEKNHQTEIQKLKKINNKILIVTLASLIANIIFVIK